MEYLKGIFLNTLKENCSIHESGIMCFDCLKQSNLYSLDYLEISKERRTIPQEYDFYIFNYHPTQMEWLDTSFLKNIPGTKYTLVLEISPQNPFASVNEADFDGFIVLDPTIDLPNPKVFPFARPLELNIPVKEHTKNRVVVIGSFGYPTPGKGFELIVDAVNKEFDEAIVRINIPPVNEKTKKFFNQLYNTDYTEYLENLCKNVAKVGITVEVTRKYFTKEELINWCSENTLNCFMYNRFQTGLSATTDQAIVSGRPLAISVNETFRHIHQFITPYPFRSLKDAIKLSETEVKQIKSDWTNEKFRSTFEQMVISTDCKVIEKKSLPIILESKQSLPLIPENIIYKIFRKLNRLSNDFITKSASQKLIGQHKKYEPKCLLEIPEKGLKKDTILLVSHAAVKCGIHEFGWNLKEALKKSGVYHFCYAECSNAEELAKAVKASNPKAIVYNYYLATMPWLTQEIVSKYTCPKLGYVHEFDHLNFVEMAKNDFFDYSIFPDPSLDVSKHNNFFTTGRLLANYQNYFNLPLIPTIGSFGFGFPDKGFERLVTIVQNEFDEAIIKINMPFNDVVDPDGKKMIIPTANRCNQIVKKTGIQLQITHDFLSQEDILNFLASNTINVFLYNSEKKQGISSVLDYSLSVQRPIAITSVGMFRHVGNILNDISIEKNTLHSIIERGVTPLVPFFNDWSEARMILCYENILNQVLKNDLHTRYYIQSKDITL